MSLLEYHKSIGSELVDIKNRVRNLLGPEFHKLSDGKHKESILRDVLSRHLPKAISARNGFVRYDDDSVSTEIDVLLYHNDRPLLFQNDDLVITTPITVFGGIEVKTNIRTAPEMLEIFNRLGDISQKARSLIHTSHWQELDFNKIGKSSLPWFSLFSYSCDVTDQLLLEKLNESAQGDMERVVRCLCLGPDKFVRFWHAKKDTAFSGEPFTGWRVYQMPGLAISYFISNMIWQDNAKTNDSNPWFALDDKEVHVVQQLRMS